MSYRETMPQCAALFDEFKSVFGDGVKVTYAEENGIVRGKQSVEGISPCPDYQKEIARNEAKRKLARK